jgi:hypothetical protein
VNRELVWCVYGVFVGWWLCRWYEGEKQRLMWEVEHQAQMAAWRVSERTPEPAPEVAVS